VKSVTLRHVNKHIASSIAGLILPTDSVTGARLVFNVTLMLVVVLRHDASYNRSFVFF
jgi:hypothetical protein